MSSLQILRRRIKSIQNTRQITKAMELVAASKMRKSQIQALQPRPYAGESLNLIKDLSNKIDRAIHPLLANRDIQKIMLIVVTSDRGLAGAYNALLLREVVKFLQFHRGQVIDLITIGKKGLAVLSKISGLNFVAAYTDFPTHPTSLNILPIATTALEGFASTKYDSVQIAYTHFHSTVKQEPRIEELLPLKNGNHVIQDDPQPQQGYDHEYIFEPNPDLVFDFILPRVVEMQIHQRILEAIASEHSARMVAMKNASDNAREIIGDLQLTYNSARQAKVTQELLEITSGASI